MGFWDTVRTNSLNAKAVMGSNKTIGNFQGQLLDALKPGVQAGVGSALDLLSQKGRDVSGADELARREIEAERQILQQDISQQGAAAGATGNFSSAALQAMGNRAASRKKQELSVSSALGQDEQRRKDLASILQGLFQQSGINLIQNRTDPLPKEPGMTGFQNLFQSLGQGFGTYAQQGLANDQGLYLGKNPGRG